MDLTVTSVAATEVRRFFEVEGVPIDKGGLRVSVQRIAEPRPSARSVPASRVAAASQRCARTGSLAFAAAFAERLVREPVARLGHELSAEIGLGGESVMGSAAQREIVLAALAALRERLEVMQLQVVRFAAALSGGIDVSTAPAVPLEHGAPNGGRNMASATALLLPLHLRAVVPRAVVGLTRWLRRR